ncbi:hypothetical protein AAMO2058_001222700 [Amorphochlora amoebiformis]|mmetsp:Transcript_2022/g.2799  ORF Transcript_2022/g.2799 Transcript_2022/m.2799 type:complete len:459 (-) Transcript_2022:163-1539(-)
MVNIKTISRSEDDFKRARKRDVDKVFKNPNPEIHPFEKAREYKRALNAVKLDKVFAKPFLFALDGHLDSVWSMETLRTSLRTLISGSCDGELRVWNLGTRTCTWKAKAHDGFVRGIASDSSGERMVTCGDDSTVKIWNISGDSSKKEATESTSRNVKPLATYLGKSAFVAISHHYKTPTFATAGSTVELWDERRSDPTHSFEWGADTINTVKFNPVEVNVLASSANDRNIVLYDVRQRTAMRKMILHMATNAICWNPMEAFNFTTGNEDHNCYTFDMRKMDRALNIHKDHVGAIMAIDYAPTGREFVTGSFDRTIRIFNSRAGHSREVYHTRRMQRLFTVKFSQDNRYVLSGSDDGNIRLWKARASEQLKTLLPGEKTKRDYLHKLKKRFKAQPEIRKIARHRHVPKPILKAKKLRHTIKKARNIKLANKIKHSKPGSIVKKSAREEKIVVKGNSRTN